MAIPVGMADVPILAVDLACLNDQYRAGECGNHDNGVVCRGLTMSTSQTTLRYQVPRVPEWLSVLSYRSGNSSKNSTGGFGVASWEEYRFAQPSGMHTTKKVTAVLVLYGLPRMFIASILAHEAMHVWCKLSPQMTNRNLSDVVEEGMCQLVSHKYLEFLDNQYEALKIGGKGDPSAGEQCTTWEHKLVKYNMFVIETDTTPVYGEGFRLAGKAYADIGLPELLNYISESGEFPVSC